MNRISYPVDDVAIVSCHNTGLGIIRALGAKSIPVTALYYDRNDMGYLSKYVKNRYFVPHPENDVIGFLHYLRRFSSNTTKPLLIPADDSSLVTISKYKNELEKLFIVGCTDWEITKLFLHKANTYKLSRALGIPTPSALLKKDFDEIDTFIKNAGFPLLIKPSQSHLFYNHFGVKLFKVRSRIELMEKLHEVSSTDLEVMLQEYIPGDDTENINYNSYIADDRVIEFTAKKVRLSPADLGVPCVVVSAYVPEVIEYGRSILKGMNFSGYACTEFKKDKRDGVYKLLEVNGRHNRSALLAHMCGINFPYIQYDYLVNNQFGNTNGFRKHIFWIDITKDLFSSPQYLKRNEYSIWKFLKPYFSKKVFAVLDLSDPLPFIKRCYNLTIRIYKTFLKTLYRR